MPPRWMSALIIVSWLAAMGWLFWHDLWPGWKPGEPPQFSIDEVEEVQNPERPKTSWSVQRRDSPNSKLEDIYRATTWIDYQPQEDVFTLHARMTARKPAGQQVALPLPLGFAVRSMSSQYRVTRTGQLRELRISVNVIKERPSTDRKSKEPTVEEAELVMAGQVRGEQFFAHCRASASLLPQHLEIELPPVSVSHNASVLLPLHPVNRIHGLRPGQGWRQPLIDPFRDATNALFGLGGATRYLNARVLPQPQVLQTTDGSETMCLVIEYEEEGQLAGRTWVEQDSEQVAQQEAILEGVHWFMKRDNPRKRR